MRIDFTRRKQENSKQNDFCNCVEGGDNPKWSGVDCGEDREAIVIKTKRRKDTSWTRIYDCRKKVPDRHLSLIVSKYLD